jgi:DNA processing protein
MLGYGLQGRSSGQGAQGVADYRTAMEFGREVFGVPGNVTQEVSFAPNQLIKQGAKLVTNAEDLIEELPTPVQAALVQGRRSKASRGICRQRTD